MATTRPSAPSNNSNRNNNGVNVWIGNPSLRKLSTLLRNEGHRVLSGASAFTLTTDVLTQLNTDCRRHSLTENDAAASEATAPAASRSFLPLTSRQRVQQDASRSRAEWGAHIQFIKDFMLSTPSLKLICSSGTLSAPISLHRFGNLNCLNLRKVPIHMVEGLQNLRATLTSITVYRSVDKVKDLLEFCGGDMSAPITWPQLKFVSFTFNSISALDDSLRLLTHVEVLDLSHNSLDTCNGFLELLGDVKRITLAYNFLTSIMSVSLTTRASLTWLALRGNSLDNVKGIEELIFLQELDLGENCISDHTFLAPLQSLVRLKQLQLDGNPLFYHRLHRPLTAKCLSAQALSAEFLLDRRRLTPAEISQNLPLSKPGYKGSTPRYLSTQRAAVVRSNTPDSDYGMSPSSGIGTENESMDSSVSNKFQRRIKRRRRKVRQTEIQDLEHSGNHSSSHDISPGTSPHMHNFEQQWKARREDALKTQKEIEELRKHFGPNWLQAIEDRDIFNKRKSSSLATSSQSPDTEAVNTKSKGAEFNVDSKSSSDSDTKPDKNMEIIKNGLSGSGKKLKEDQLETDGDSDSVDARGKDANNPIMAAIARMAAGESADESNLGDKVSTSFKFPEFGAFQSSGTIPNTEVKIQKSSRILNGGSEMSEESSKNSPKLGSVMENGDKSDMEIGSQVLLKEDHDSDIIRPNLTLNDASETEKKKNIASLANPTEQMPAQEDGNSSSQKFSNDLRSSGTMDSEKRLQKEEDIVNSLEMSEGEKVSKSIFASLPLQNNEMIILTLTSLFLLEKDVRGKVTEKLELASLISVGWKSLKKETSDGVGKTEKLGWKSLKKEPSDGVGKTEKLGDGGLKEGVDGGGGGSGIGLENGAANQNNESVQLDLKFEYMRKDRQRRCYVVDHADGKVILEHVQPFLDSRLDRERAKLSVVVQCLKCNKKFQKSELIQPDQLSSMPKSGSRRDLPSDQDSSDKPVLVCPKCGSSLVIELETVPSPVKSTSSASSTQSGSYTPSTGSYMNQAKKSTPSVKRKSFDMTRDTQSRLFTAAPTGRERSSAFREPTRMSTSLIHPGELKMSEGDELICVEDHFSADTMTSMQTAAHLAAMTTSLRGDSSTRGSKSHVERMSSREAQMEDGSQNQTKILRERVLTNNEYENGVTSGIDIPTRQVSVGKRVSSLDDGEKEEVDDRIRSDSIRNSVHKSLAAMEDIVNSLVSEGRCLEEQESFAVGSYSSLKGKSVSVSSFMKSSHGQRRKSSLISVPGEVDGANLRQSESSSSIAVLPAPASATNLESQGATIPAAFSSSVPVKFIVGSLAESADDFAGNSDRGSTTIVSPLSSSICSSMVSSVYETSVNNSEKENSAISSAGEVGDIMTNNTDSTDNIDQSPNIVVVGSSSSSSEDLSSIYDHPRKPKGSSAKKSRSTLKASPIMSAEQSKSGSSQEEPATLVPIGQNDSRTTTPMQSLAGIATLASASDDTLAVSDEGEEDEEGADQSVVPQYAFHHLNHRLMLYMMMSLFGADEEFLCKIQSQIVQYIIEKSYEGILVMSSTRFYILKITSDDHSQPPDQWLHCVEIQPVPELRYIDVGLGGQSLRLEFVTDCSSYTFITRSRDKTLQFMEILHTNLAKYAVLQGIASHVVVNEDIDQTTVDNLDRDVVSKIKPDQRLLHYCMGFIERGNQKLFPISFVITTCDLCLVCTNHQWPQPRLQAPITEETVGKQFTVLERQKISNIASVEVCEASMRKIRLELFNETEGVSANWNITLATRQSTVDFINALSEPWAKEFGVEMDVVYAELAF